MLKCLSRIVCVCFLFLFAASTRADTLTLKDGSVFEGKILEENGAEVVMEVVISNIKTTRTFPRYKVQSIEYAEVEEAEPEGDESKPSVKPADREAQQEKDTETELDEEATKDSPSARATARDRASARASRMYFMQIPIEGTIGEQTNATGLKNALLQARRRGVSHIVFTIDSPGGFLYDAIQALEVLKEFDDEFEYHAMVEEGAISAASIYVAASDHIWVRPGARVGGAVAYSNDTTSGAAEVDAKLNSIWAADIASRAQTKGHPPEVFRAMVEPAAELWVDAEGNTFTSRPSSNGAQQLDNATSILTIRADQMIAIGMAEEFDADIDKLGDVLGLETWVEVKTLGIRAMKKAGGEREELSERYAEAMKVYIETLKDYERDHPASFDDYRYYTDLRGGEYADGPSFQKWRERTDRTIRHCDVLLEALARMASVNKRAEKIGADHLQYVSEEIGTDAYQEIQDARAELVRNRNKPPMP
ncbi:MAG: hypothetical protein JJ916_09835 [Phycisphaerales bacterium]|nr:hypothetical protein [Phycisphaerales bacterium]